MQTLVKDLRYALRVLARNPEFAAVAVLALAMGIGANTAIFSVVNTVILRPLPYPQPERLLKLWCRFTGIGIPNDRNWVSAPEFMDFRRLNHSFSHLAAMYWTSFNVSSGGMPERVQGVAVSADFFPALGVEPLLGRTFSTEEEQPGRDDVVVIGYGLWQRRFGADRGLVGRKLQVNDRPFTVVGVLPARFQFPDEVEMWTPLAFSAEDLSANNRGAHGLQALARLKPGVSMAQARADLDAVSQRVIEQNPNYPYRQFNFAVIASPLLEEIIGDVKTALWILMGAVGCVLLIACANVANLLMARATARVREIAIRTALGAAQARLVRQLLTESLLLAALGGAGGLLLAHWALRALRAASATVLPRIAEAQLDARVLAFTAAVSLVTGVLFGLAPAFQSARSITHDALKEGGRAASSGRISQRLRSGLVVAEIALSLVLLAGAGLLLKSFLKLQEVDPGFRAEGVLTVRLALPDNRYGDAARVRAFYRELLERVRAIPGVGGAGAVSALPLSGTGSSGTTTADTRAVTPDNASFEADRRVATPGYFQAMGIQLVRGRYFDERDNDTAQPAAIVDETFAQTYWPGEDAIGQRVKLGGRRSPQPWMTIVGVVRHVRYRTLEANSRVTVYWPHAQSPWPWRSMSLAIRTTAEPRSLLATVQRQVLGLDPDQPVYAARTMAELLAQSVARRKLSMALLGIFAAAALALAAIGIYGVMSYSVTQRAHEVGIRMALGAETRDVLRLVLGQSLSLTLAGVALGIAGSLALTRLISTLLFQVKTTDLATLSAVAAALTAVASLASYVPARRAAAVDPVVALRQE